MPLQSHRYQCSLQALATLLAGALLTMALPGGSVAVTSDAGAPAVQVVCQGFDACQNRGYSHQGYKSAKSKMYWNMYAGINCTNYVAYRMIKNGGSATRPAQLKPGKGNATYWGTSFGYNATPMVGSIAWWKAGTNGGGSAGHVAYVEQVVSASEIVVSESNYGSEFDWRRITKKGPWPTGFIHYKDVALAATAAPTITGTARVGAQLKATAGAWSPAATGYAYQWLAGGAAIAGATGATFTPGPAQLGQAITVQVTATRASYVAGAATSAATAAVAPGNQKVLSQPSISGTAQVDQPLTVNPGSYQPAPEQTSFQWLADGVAIPGATGATYVPGQAQANQRISVTVTATRAGYNPRVTTTAPTAPVLAPDIAVVQPGGVKGDLLVGETLTADPGVLQPADATASYVWMRDGQPMPAFRGQHYVVKPRDIGKTISVKVRLSHPGYRDKTLVLGPVKGVKAPTRLIVKAATRKPQQALIKVLARTPDARKPTGVVWVKIQGRKRAVRLTDGVGRIRVTGLRPGQRALRAYYAGNERLARARVAVKVTVRPARGRR